MKKLIVAVVVLMLVIPGAFARDLTNREKSAIMVAVKNQLNDPESARFKWMKVRKDPAYAFSVCSLVNAKNSYGGYAGYQTFWAVAENGKIAVIFNEADGGDVVLSHCQDLGYDFSEAK